MKKTLTIGALLALVGLSTVVVAGDSPTVKADDQSVTSKPSVPNKDELTKANKRVREMFRKDLAAKSADEKVALGKKLLRQAKELKDAPPLQYAMFTESASLLLQGGDPPSALGVIDRIDNCFSLPSVLAAKADILAKGTSLSGSLDLPSRIAESCLVIVREAIENDEYDVAQRVAGIGNTAANKGKEMALVSQFQTASQQIPVIKKEYEATLALRKELKAGSDDPEKSLKMGRFLCLVKGDWREGLPYLAKSSDDELKKAAKQELADSSRPEAWTDIADAWWDIGKKLKGIHKDNCLLQSGKWYDKTIPMLKGESAKRPIIRLREAKGSSWVASQLPKVFLVAHGDDDLSLFETLTKGHSWRLKTLVMTREVLEDKATFDYADVIVIGGNALRATSIDHLTAKFQENLGQFVQERGDLFCFEQWGAENTGVLNKAFGIKVYGEGTKNVTITDLAFQGTLERIHETDAVFYNWYDGMPKSSRILLRLSKSNKAVGLIAPCGKGRLILLGVSNLVLFTHLIYFSDAQPRSAA